MTEEEETDTTTEEVATTAETDIHLLAVVEERSLLKVGDASSQTSLRASAGRYDKNPSSSILGSTTFLLGLVPFPPFVWTTDCWTPWMHSGLWLVWIPCDWRLYLRSSARWTVNLPHPMDCWLASSRSSAQARVVSWTRRGPLLVGRRRLDTCLAPLTF